MSSDHHVPQPAGDPILGPRMRLLGLGVVKLMVLCLAIVTGLAAMFALMGPQTPGLAKLVAALPFFLCVAAWHGVDGRIARAKKRIEAEGGATHSNESFAEHEMRSEMARLEKRERELQLTALAHARRGDESALQLALDDSMKSFERRIELLKQLHAPQPGPARRRRPRIAEQLIAGFALALAAFTAILVWLNS